MFFKWALGYQYHCLENTGLLFAQMRGGISEKEIMTTALVTGISGFVGSHLAHYLLANTDWDIVGMIRWRSSLENLTQDLSEAHPEGGRLRFVTADLRDDMAVRAAVEDAKPDYVFHLAAQSNPQTSFVSPLDTIETNTQGTIRLLEALREFARADCRIHVCSSSEVYGRTSVRNIDENQPFHPASPYAISKIGADLAAQFYAEAYGMHIQVTRMFTHTGPRRGDVFAESSFAKQIAMIETGTIPPVIHVGNLDSTRTLADVRDAVRAYHMLLTVNADDAAGEVYNIGGDHTCTIREILMTLKRLAGSNPDFTAALVKADPERMRPIDADVQVPDCRKFVSRTGWKPQYHFEETMRDLLEYWRERVKLGGVINR